MRAIPLIFLLLPLTVLAVGSIRALFLFKDVMVSNTAAITTSGFNTVIMFGLGVLPSGDIMYYSNTPGSKDVPVATDGSYAGGPALAAKVRSLKSGDVTRVEICTNMQNVAALMRSPGAGPDTRLYRNLAALKDAWGLDAVSNDDESAYDASSTAAFAHMVGAVGLKYTIVPYTMGPFWASLISNLNGPSVPAGRGPTGGLLDRVYLQCYDGGAGNDPIAWRRQLGMPVVPILWVTNDSPGPGDTASQMHGRFAAWKTAGGGGEALAGAGLWNDYDIEKMHSLHRDYGAALRDVFP